MHQTAGCSVSRSSYAAAAAAAAAAAPIFVRTACKSFLPLSFCIVDLSWIYHTIHM